MDNGTEFSHHEWIAKRLETSIYFAHPYHSWERGLNENTNGLIRQYIPKGSSFADLTPEQIKKIENRINSRPRKSLNYATPDELYKDVGVIILNKTPAEIAHEILYRVKELELVCRDRYNAFTSEVP